MKNAPRARRLPDTVEAAGLLREKIGQVPNRESVRRSIIRVEVEIEPTDALAWLSAQSADQKIYWEDREHQLEIAGLGSADCLGCVGGDELEQLIASIEDRLRNHADGCRYFGGLRFNRAATGSEIDSEWKVYGTGRFVLPRFELVTRAGHANMICNIAGGDCTPAEKEEIKEQLASLVFPTPDINVSLPQSQQRVDIPDQHEWAKEIRHALQSITSGAFEKVVLARKSTFAFASHPNPWYLLRRLHDNSTNCYLFGFQVARGTAMVGASPERLYHRTGRTIMSEALAGTTVRGRNESEDAQLEQQLLESEKDRREHQLVADALRETLGCLCRDLTWDEQVSVRKLAWVQHLYCHFDGTLDDDTGDLDLLTALHPTPAVGGYPRERAREEIARLESFDRGWYAGPIGWIGQNAAEFAVAIRSALVRRNRLALYSGAGIVEGSTPECEWDEIENKIISFMKVLTSP